MKRAPNKLMFLFPLVVLITVSLLLFPLGTAPAQAAGPTCYVDDTATGANNGGSWGNAYTDLQSALGDAGCTEIWVAAGTYRPGASGANSAVFNLKSGVAIYGGFAGTETVRMARNWTVNVTILSGDLDASGTKTSNDAYRVVYGYNVNASAVLDGFTITGGYAVGSSVDGAGIAFLSSSPTLANLIITANTANGQGAGMLNVSSNPSLSNVTISGNLGALSNSNGTGMYNSTSSPALVNVTFSGNHGGGNGGGMCNVSSSNPTLTNVTFIGNVSTTAAGGGMFNDTNSSPRLVNVSFIGNTAATYAGGMYSRTSNYSLTNGLFSGNTASYGGGMANNNNTPTLTNVTFSHNTATTSGGGIYNYSGGNPVLNNVILWGNSATNGAQIYNSASTPVIAYSDIQDAFPGGSWDTSLGINAGNNLAADPLFRDADGVDNTYGTADDNLRLTKASPAANTGSSAALPADLADLDGDGNTGEPLPLDLDLGGRVYGASVDMGAYEFRLWYVNFTGAAGNGCTSWADACPSLQTALGKAGYGDEIWAAAGTYRPGAASGAQTSTFQLKSGVAIYGGFAGTETLRTARNWTTNLTTLSGDLDSSGGATSNDAYHVVTANGVDGNAVLDGFTITGGMASGGGLPHNSGAGLYNDGGSPTLANLIVSNNTAAQGAGMYNNAASPSLSSVTFSANSTTRNGAGMYNNASSPSLTNVTFSSNTATHWGTALSSGGGMYNTASSPILTGGAFNNNTAEDCGGGMYNTGSSPTLIGVTFSGNTAGSNGGGMDNEASSNPALTNVTFSSNKSTNAAGGGVFNDVNSSPTFTNVTFTGNQAATWGGGMYSRTSHYTLTGGAFNGNSAQYGGGMANNNGVPTLTDVTFSNNTATSVGGGMYNYEGGSPTLTNVTFNGNSTSGSGGGMYNSASSPALTNVTFSSNTANGNGGGMDNEASSNVILTHVAFNSNVSTTAAGGGMFNDTSSSLVMADITFTSNSAATLGGGMYSRTSNYTLNGGAFNGNSAKYGGGMANNNNAPALRDVTFSGNTASSDGGGMYNYGAGNPVLIRVTFTGNSAVGWGGGIYNASSSPALTNVLFSSNTASSGGGMYNTASSPSLVGVAFSLNRADYFGGGMENINSSSPSLVNVTLAYNHAGRFGGGVDNYLYSNPAFTNSVIGGNTAGQGGAQVLNYASTPSFAYSDIQSAYASGVWDSALGSDLGHNLGDDPLFNTPSGRLGSTSPALDIANAAALPPDLYDLDGDGNTSEPLPLDLDEGGRFYGAGLDLGAYELHVWYVDIDASGSGCTSWADACPDLQTALALLPGEIWVAEGAYRPGASGEVNAAFHLRDGQALYGGFTGIEASREQRDWVTHVVTLTGDLDASGGFSASDAYHVVDTSNTGSSVRLDGFTITGAYNDGGYGGGIYSYSGSPILTNLVIRGNRAKYGGGIYNTGSPTLNHVTFTGNYAATYGGGMHNSSGSPTLNHVTFSGNTTSIYGGGMGNTNGNPALSDVTFSGNTALIGGGMWTASGSPLLVNVIFVGNSSNHRFGGGGMNCMSGGSLTLVNVTFSHNTASGNGGGMSNRGCSPTLVNVTFSHNAANGNGGGMYNWDANPALKNVLMWGNTASDGAQIYNYNDSDPEYPVSSIPTIAYSDIQGSGGSGAWNTGLGVDLGGNLDADPLFVDPDGADDIYGTLDDDLRLRYASPANDAGNNAAVPADTTDLDGDGNITEALPYDLEGTPRFQDANRPDTGSGTAPIIDMGAFETPHVMMDAGPDQSVVEGELAAFTGDIYNPDLVTAISWDFGDGGTITGVLTPTHSFMDNGVYTVTLTLTDTVRGAAQDTLLVAVANGDPVLGFLGDQTVVEDTPLDISVAYTDPGALDTHTAQIDWGDGSVTDGVVDPLNGLVSGSHTYAAPGTYTLILTIYDDDGGVDTLTIQVFVTNHMIYLPLTLR